MKNESGSRREQMEDLTKRQVRYLEAPTRKIIESLRELNLDQVYDAILSDDAGARIHSLLLWKIMKGMGKDDLQLFFVQGGAVLKNEHGEAVQQTKEYIQSISKSLGCRVLIVTEEIMSGRSVSVLARALQENGITVDVAAFGLTHEFEAEGISEMERIQRELPEHVTLISGEAGSSAQLPEELTRLWHRNESTNGRPMRKITEETQIMGRAARDEVDKLANKLTRELSQDSNIEN